MADIVSVILRAFSFLLLLQAAGVALFIGLFGAALSHSEPVLRRLGVGSAALALAFVTGHYGLEAARMAGEFAGVWDLSLQSIVMRSSSGAAFVLRFVGLVLVLGKRLTKYVLPS